MNIFIPNINQLSTNSNILKKLIFLFFLVFINFSFSQNNKTVYVNFIDETIIADGILNESAWDRSKPATDFWEYFPTDSLQAKRQTEIKMMFDNENLYVGIKVNAAGNEYIVPSLRRDFRASGNDNISLLFDTFNDGTSAFFFGSNPYGVKREALISSGGNELKDFNTTWDTKWVGESKINENYYITEWIIPLSAFKYRQGETKWRFSSYLFDTQDNVRNTWTNIPQNQMIFGLAYMGDMIFEKPLGKSNSPISIIPYANGIVGKDFETSRKTSDLKIGGDAKFTIGNSMNLDITLNPDFSQVEVDQQVTNLTRYEVSLPERRQFFIENSDLFGAYGNNRDANPFFSRRIGIAQDVDENNIENKIIGGLRLSGKLSNNFRLGILNMQTEEDLENEIPTTNNSVIALQQKLFSRSNLSLMFINKQTTKNYDFTEETERYNRVIGLDYQLASPDNSWTGKYYIHKSFSPNTNGDDFSTGASTGFSNRNFRIQLSGLYVGENFRSDLGYIKRTDIFKINPEFSKLFWPKKGKIQNHEITVAPIYIWKPKQDFENSDYLIMSKWQASFNNTSELSFGMENWFTRLYEEFDPTRTDDATPLPIGDYRYTSFELNYRSDMRKQLSFNLTPSFGKFYTGNKYSFKSSLTWRLQPNFSSSIQINHDKIVLPKPYQSASIWLIGPKFDITFNKELFWATFIQYSSQRNNFSVNTRLQWRFAPLSDLFVVYNDNYLTEDGLTPRFRTFNIKLTYWLNL
jgi:hypothetical protein